MLLVTQIWYLSDLFNTSRWTKLNPQPLLLPFQPFGLRFFPQLFFRLFYALGFAPQRLKLHYTCTWEITAEHGGSLIPSRQKKKKTRKRRAYAKRESPTGTDKSVGTNDFAFLEGAGYLRCCRLTSKKKKEIKRATSRYCRFQQSINSGFSALWFLLNISRDTRPHQHF